MRDFEVTLNTYKLMLLKAKASLIAREIAQALATDAHRYIDGHWSGYVPPRSSPGQPPAIETGNLKNSANIQTQQKGTSAESTLSFFAEYAAYLEYGTRIMAARPFLRPGVENTRKKAVNITKDVLKKYL